MAMGISTLGNYNAIPMPSGRMPLLPAERDWMGPVDRFEPSQPLHENRSSKKGGKSKKGKRAAAQREKQAQIDRLKSEIAQLKADLERRRYNMDNQEPEYRRLAEMERSLAQLEGRSQSSFVGPLGGGRISPLEQGGLIDLRM